MDPSINSIPEGRKKKLSENDPPKQILFQTCEKDPPKQHMNHSEKTYINVPDLERKEKDLIRQLLHSLVVLEYTY